MSSYHQFTQKDRTELAFMLREGYDQIDIADKLEIHNSSVNRELTRNSDRITGKYHARLAQISAERRRKQIRIPGQKISEDQNLKEEVESRIKEYFSPEQIAGDLNNEYGKTIVGKDTVYAYIDNFAPKLQKYLRFQKNKYRKRKGTKQREKRREKDKKRRINERPEYVEKKEELGHWEGDTVWSKDKQYAIVTLVERVSGVSLARIVPNKSAEEVNKAIILLFSKISPDQHKTLTLDNGSEFAKFEEIERKLGITIYFAYPYHSWERGANENFNGLLRQFFPKGMYFYLHHQSKLQRCINLLNNRPRKRLSYFSPLQVFSCCTS